MRWLLVLAAAGCGRTSFDSRPLPVFVTTHAYIGTNELGATLFHGSIDEVAVYGRALSEAAIAKHFEIGITGQ